MGTRGPRAKNTDRERPDIAEGRPDAPNWINQNALEEYTRVADLLTGARLLTLTDRAHLTAYAQAWGEFEDLCLKIGDEGHVSITEKGSYVLNPLCQARDSAHRRMLASAAKLGLSIIDRERITQPKAKSQKDPLSEFLED